MSERSQPYDTISIDDLNKSKRTRRKQTPDEAFNLILIGAYDEVLEAPFTDLVLHEMELRGWLCEHVYESYKYARRRSKGFPDIIALRNGRIIVAELKTEKGKISEAQAEWWDAWAEVWTNSANVHQALWRPSMWNLILEVIE